MSTWCDVILRSIQNLCWRNAEDNARSCSNHRVKEWDKLMESMETYVCCTLRDAIISSSYYSLCCNRRWIILNSLLLRRCIQNTWWLELLVKLLVSSIFYCKEDAVRTVYNKENKEIWLYALDHTLCHPENIISVLSDRSVQILFMKLYFTKTLVDQTKHK